MLARGSVMTANEAQLFVKMADEDGNKRLSFNEVLTALSQMVAQITVGKPRAIPKDLLTAVGKLTRARQICAFI